MAAIEEDGEDQGTDRSGRGQDRRVRQQSGTGEDLCRPTAPSVPRCSPAAEMTARAPQPDVGHERRRRVVCQSHAARQSLDEPNMVPRPRKTAAEDRRGCGKLQINRLFCKPICKPDAARQHGTGETEPTERDMVCPVRRGHRTRERQPETPETRVVWLITQRSRVQIPPPLLRVTDRTAGVVPTELWRWPGFEYGAGV